MRCLSMDLFSPGHVVEIVREMAVETGLAVVVPEKKTGRRPLRVPALTSISSEVGLEAFEQ